MPEDRGPHSLDAHVRQLLADLGLYGYHTRNSQGSEPGWPDWVIVGNAILYRELKSQRRGPTPAQRDVGERIKRAGGNWAVWRPSDLLDGTIAAQLENIAVVQGVLFPVKRLA